jgi:hypothetical protein
MKSALTRRFRTTPLAVAWTLVTTAAHAATANLIAVSLTVTVDED